MVTADDDERIIILERRIDQLEAQIRKIRRRLFVLAVLVVLLICLMFPSLAAALATTIGMLAVLGVVLLFLAFGAWERFVAGTVEQYVDEYDAGNVDNRA